MSVNPRFELKNFLVDGVLTTLVGFGTYYKTPDTFLDSVMISCSSLSLFLAFDVLKLVRDEELNKDFRNEAKKRLYNFAEYLVRNNVSVNGEGLINAKINDCIVKYGDLEESIRSFSIPSKNDTKQVLVQIRDSLARDINDFKIVPYLELAHDRIFQYDDKGLYLLDGWEFSRKLIK